MEYLLLFLVLWFSPPDITINVGVFGDSAKEGVIIGE